MKIRPGFVSNSSSTSFCIFGKNYSMAGIKDPNVDMAMIENVVSDHGLDCMVFDESYIIVGLAVEELCGDETFDQFKDRAAQGLKTFERDFNGIEATSSQSEWHYGEHESE